MVKVYVGLGVAVVFFTVYALVDCIIADERRVRALPKSVWALVILLIAPIGGILWFTLGKNRGADATMPREVAPDDDPTFLQGLSRDKDQAERIRRLEQELADLDDDPKD